MKKLFSITFFMGLMTMNVFAQVNKSDAELRKLIVGKWCNPYTYQYSGETKGFHYKKNGKCEAIGIPSLDLKTWEVKNGKIYTKGFSLKDDGKTWEEYKTVERIELLNKDTLEVLATENPRTVFRYLNLKHMKKNVKPDTDNK